ncbi:hypothetical protein K438DRAFT_1850743 [Mycena galopus ATCC 62051]|nr:hypothetical protein K438DRAFT_1850743 [Mycena galopus ATCC 62051]
MRVSFALLVVTSLFATTLGRRSRLVTRAPDNAAPLPTAKSGSGGHKNGQGINQCPSSTTACLRHRQHGGHDQDQSKAQGTPTLDCIDTDVDFRSCAY